MEKLKNIIDTLLEQNDERLKKLNEDNYDKGYAEGYHDALVDIIMKMDI